MTVQLTPRPTLASLRIERRCASCGYGALLPPQTIRSCPMCGRSAWVDAARAT